MNFPQSIDVILVAGSTGKEGSLDMFFCESRDRNRDRFEPDPPEQKVHSIGNQPEIFTTYWRIEYSLLLLAG